MPYGKPTSMNPNLSKLNRPLLLYSAVLAVVAVFLFLFATGPLREKIVAENEEIQKIYARVENDQRKISHLSEFRDQSVSIAGDGEKLRLLLPEDRVVDFIREAEGNAKAAGGTVVISKGNNLEESRKAASIIAASQIKTADGTTDDRQKGTGLLKKFPDGRTLGLTLTFSGKYPDAVDFLHKIETAPYFLDVLSMDIRPIDSKQEQDGSVRSDVFSAPVGGSGVPNGTADGTPAEDTVRAEFDIIVYLE